jgi:molybdopterin-binding protein
VKLSARNQIKAKVKQVTPGSVNTEVVLEVSPGVTVTAMISKQSAERLGLAPGKDAYAVIKASDVMVAVD